MNTLPGSIHAEIAEQMREHLGEHNNGFAVYGPPKPTMQAVFFDHEVENSAASANAGIPQYTTKTHVRIFVSGKAQPLFEGQADEGHIAQYPQAYAAYKQGKQLEAQGLPLYQWAHPRMTKGRIETARRFNVFTLEQRVEADIGWISQMGPEWLEVQKAAKDYMQSAQKAAPRKEVNELREALAQKDNEISMLREQMEEMSRKFCEITNQEYKPAAGYTPKAKK